jgi:magnesium chelatase family protein
MGHNINLMILQMGSELMPLSVVHNVLMISPPGTGKTLFLPAIWTFLTIDEIVDVTRIYSIADMLLEDSPPDPQPSFPHPTSHHIARRIGSWWHQAASR